MSAGPADRDRMRYLWADLCRRLDCPELADRYPELDAGYSEPHRAYHGWTHIRECLDVWERCPEEAAHPDELELAIWLHDVVYRPLRPNNEKRSARLATRWLEACPAASIDGDRVARLILATRHPAVPKTRDEALLQDVDLHILGAAPERYAEYEAQVREEYRMVPSPLFRRKRAKLLRELLSSGPLYRTEWFRAELEDAARRNVVAALAVLDHPPSSGEDG